MDDETQGTESGPTPDEAGHEDVSGGETSPPSGAPEEAADRDIESDAANADAGGKAHTSSEEGHPAGDGPRTDRDVGGPVADENAEETTGGVHGTRETGVEPHE